MKAIKKLLDTTAKRVIAIALLALLVTWLILFFVARDVAIGLIKPFLWTFLVVAVSWVAIHFGLKAWRKRKRSEFDQAVAAKEGIEDRRREWSTWTAELEKQGIDRYELPFYLLVGEPQSGKSVLLHNSDLHFPFGQNRLSGVGGTRGCDWWFTEEAVILDLAGRLFTHEGGAADRLEFEAFLQLLSEFRPLCPANGVILVIPCDSLLRDSAEQCAAKATKIQSALLTLTTKLQAQLPVYLVLTKGDQVFGFAESVHRLDVERRHQMFGWSRPAEKLDAPFDLTEVVQGFEELVRRGRLLRAHMSAGARLPEALPEVDRMYAFPHELAGMQPNLEVYLKRIFTASNITDRVFFRGVYLTSGLQSGVPIAKVCKELFGQTGDADMRDLQALFSKPRAYFIKDLIRTRVFGERGLVRPTQGRVQQTRRAALVGYGLSGLVVFASVVWAAVYLMTGVTDERQRICDEAIAGASQALKADELPVQDLLHRLQQIQDAAELNPEGLEQTFSDPRAEAFQELYCELFDARLVPLVRTMALDAIERKLSGDELRDHEDLVRVCDGLSAFTEGVDFSDASTRADVLACLDANYASLRQTREGGEPLTLSRAFEVRTDYGDDEGLLSPWNDAERPRLVGLALQAVAALERCLEPGAKTAPRKDLGYMMAWYRAEQARDELVSGRLVQAGSRPIEVSRGFAGAMRTLRDIEQKDLGSSRTVTAKDVGLGAIALTSTRSSMVEFVREHDRSQAPADAWPEVESFARWNGQTLKARGDAGPALSDLNVIFGSDDLGQTVYQRTAVGWQTVTTKIVIGGNADPQKELDDPLGLLALCEKSLPLDLARGGLAGLGARIADLDRRELEKTTPGLPLFEVFRAQCLQAADLFEKQVPTPEVAVLAISGGTAGAGAGASAGAGTGAAAPGAFSVPLVAELSDLHQALKDLIVERELEGSSEKELLEWQSGIEKLLEQHIRSRDQAASWVPEVPLEGSFPDEAWAVLEALGAASELVQVSPDKYRVGAEAERLQRGAFFALAGQLEERWRARPVDEIGETAKTVDELGRLAEQVETRLGKGAAALAAGGELGEWGARVDSILVDGVGHILGRAEELWKPEPSHGALRESLPVWLNELNSIQDKITDSEQAGLHGIDPILAGLGKEGRIARWVDLPLTGEVVADLRGFGIPGSAEEVRRHKEWRALSQAMGDVRKQDSAEDGFGAYLAVKYKNEFSTSPPPDEEKTSAGIRLVRELRRQFASQLGAEVRSSYLAELQELFEDRSSYKTLMDVLYWEPDERASEVNDNDVVEALGELLGKGGDLSKLGKKYLLESIGKQIFPPEAAEEEEWASFHRFLVALQEFLLKGGSRIQDTKFNFQIEPRVESAGSVWALRELGPEEKRVQFYFPGDNSVEELQMKVMGPAMGTLEVKDWGLRPGRPDRRLLFLWSDKPSHREAQKDGRSYVFEVPSSLAPLLLAWSGNPISQEDPREFEVLDLVPRGTNRAAPIVLKFEHAIPARPPRPST